MFYWLPDEASLLARDFPRLSCKREVHLINLFGQDAWILACLFVFFFLRFYSSNKLFLQDHTSKYILVHKIVNKNLAILTLRLVNNAYVLKATYLLLWM